MRPQLNLFSGTTAAPVETGAVLLVDLPVFPLDNEPEKESKRFEFCVHSELYGETVAVVTDIERAINSGLCACADGSDYKFTPHEIEQLKNMEIADEEFTPSVKLPHPFNLVALMEVDGQRMLLPTNFRFDKQQYATVKGIMEKAGGSYKKNAFVFNEPAIDVYNRIINGGDFNLKKKFQFFATPDVLADRVVALADIKEDDFTLEPSSGDGAIVRAVNRVCPSKVIDCVELMEANREVLKKMDTVRLVGDDFLDYHNYGPCYDKIVANPPFSKNQDIKHIRKMFELLAPGGRLVSLASPHWKTAQTKITTDFRKWLDGLGAEVHELDGGEFKESGTMIAAVIIVITKA